MVQSCSSFTLICRCHFLFYVTLVLCKTHLRLENYTNLNEGTYAISNINVSHFRWMQFRSWQCVILVNVWMTWLAYLLVIRQCIWGKLKCITNTRSYCGVKSTMWQIKNCIRFIFMSPQDFPCKVQRPVTFKGTHLCNKNPQNLLHDLIYPSMSEEASIIFCQ